VTLILSAFFSQLTDKEKSYGQFTYNTATAHVVNFSMDALAHAFGKCVANLGLWPLQPPDLNP
jgi:hypothetical protein